MKSVLVQAFELRQLIQRIGVDLFLDRLIDQLGERIAALDAALYDVPARQGFAYEDPDLGLIEWMPSMVHGSGAVVKVVAYRPTNPRRRRLPTILSSVFVFNTDTGHLDGMVDATFTTAVRTGAVSALASRVLASPKCRTLGIIGCGTQAVTQAHALSRAFPLERIIGFDIDPVASGTFAGRIGFLGLDVEMVRAEAIDSLVQRADILCTCTSTEPGQGPVFRTSEVPAHLHINAVGSDFPGKFEVPLEVLQRATVCPDFRAQAMREGECQQLPPDTVGPDLAQLLKHPEKFVTLREQLTVFDSTGWALVDHLVAVEVLRLARLHGLGSAVELECISTDSRNPYAFLDARPAIPDSTMKAPATS